MSRLALLGGTPVRTQPLPSWPKWDDQERRELLAVLDSGNWWRLAGTKVRAFEAAFAAHHSAPGCWAVTNGTHGLELALLAAGIGPGDEVVVPAFTFISTATAVMRVGAVPIAADVDPGTFCLTPASAQRALSPRTKAIIPVHMAGQMCDMDQFHSLAKSHDVHLIEDAAHAPGATWAGKSVGTTSKAAVFSFQQMKVLTAGEGGAVIAHDSDMLERLFLYHNVGRPAADRRYQHLVPGSNYRMSEWQAAVLLGQLSRLNDQTALREAHASALDRALREVPGIRPQSRHPKALTHTHYMYMFYYDSEAFGGVSRSGFIQALNAEGFPAYPAYPVIYNTELFASVAHRQPGKCPNAEGIANEVVWIHHRFLLGDEADALSLIPAIEKIREGAEDLVTKAKGAASA